jgi:hypothetical protein
MNQMTQQNTALVEEASAGAQSLQDQATNLAGAVGFFQLSDGEDTVISNAKSTGEFLPETPSAHLLLG